MEISYLLGLEPTQLVTVTQTYRTEPETKLL
jgi:hypothetical protein